ncbi:MAG: two-component system alkaline phosphatase synthesis response regulator PhoP [Granulosicoccus sp.]|jgi:two-component system alkaline phosphatase synthesis response regulator PhoP
MTGLNRRQIFASEMEAKEINVLVADDEDDVLQFVSYNLRKEGIKVHTATDGNMCLKMAEQVHPDLILLDVMMPNMDGIEVCQRLREKPQFANTLIALLTARNEDYSQLAGFDAGADEYMTKPIRPRILMARINALLKRKGALRQDDSGAVLEHFGCITVDREKHLILKGEVEIVLPKKEYELLLLLGSRTGKVFSRNEIYQALWGQDMVVGERTIDVHIRKLREKIGDDCIKTLKGVGYKFNEHCT